VARFNYTICLHINWKAHVACDFNLTVESERLLSPDVCSAYDSTRHFHSNNSVISKNTCPQIHHFLVLQIRRGVHCTCAASCIVHPGRLSVAADAADVGYRDVNLDTGDGRRWRLSTHIDIIIVIELACSPPSHVNDR